MSFSFDPFGKTTYDMGWTLKTWDFTADSNETTLTLRRDDASDDFWRGPCIDDLQVWELK